MSSIYIKPEDEEVVNLRLFERWKKIEANEIRYREYYLDDAEIVIVGFGTAGRVCMSAVRSARAEGIPVGLFRPVSLRPFPFKPLEAMSKRSRTFLVVEMNTGQMIDDVRLACAGRVPIEFYGRLGGVVPFPDEILDEIRRISSGGMGSNGDPQVAWMQRMKAKLS